uniref:RNase H family protein n=1 Tax=Solanum tuberosum TaxID=4113 RepID=M1DSQ6_SOLTU
MKGRRKKLNITEIQNAQGDLVKTIDDIGAKAVLFFEGQFRENYRHDSDDMLKLIPKMITTEQNEEMGRIPSKEEIKEVVFSLNGESTGSPDGFSSGERGKHWVVWKDISRAMFGKLWWKFRTSTSLWRTFMWNKYCKKVHPLIAKGTGASNTWKKMTEVREVIEHEIWWQVKSREASFWFDNWTKQGALYFTEDQASGEEELEIRQFITDGEWDRNKL